MCLHCPPQLTPAWWFSDRADLTGSQDAMREDGDDYYATVPLGEALPTVPCRPPELDDDPVRAALQAQMDRLRRSRP